MEVREESVERRALMVEVRDVVAEVRAVMREDRVVRAWGSREVGGWLGLVWRVEGGGGGGVLGWCGRRFVCLGDRG